jgi:hypothetical protein
MKPNQITNILNLALKARNNGDKFNPLFVGPPGIGKSEIVQQWCESQKLPFIDLRAAYLEAPDLIGFPMLKEVNGRTRTVHGTPEFWPDSGQGVILLEEPNRGTTSVMNTFMQLLTDRKVHNYTLPDGWVIVACINPETEDMDVNTMDPALKNRFEIFEVEYDREAFLDFMRVSEWDERIQNFVRGNFWTYLPPQEVAANTGAKYVSPRSFSKLNAALRAGLTGHDELIQMSVFESILGKTYGIQFFNFICKERPVFVQDLLENYDESIARLRMFSRPDNYKNGHISMLVEDVKRNESKVTDDLLAHILVTIPADQSVLLLREVGRIRKLKPEELIDKLCKNYKEVKKHIKDNLKA